MVSKSRRRVAGWTADGPRKRAYETSATRREQIVTATIGIIAERGLHAWKTAELARRVGISEPTLFRHFKSKQDILAASVRRETAMLQETVASFQGRGDGWARATGLVMSVLAFLEATGGGPLVILTGQLSAASPSTRKEILKTVTAFRIRLTALFGVAVKEMGQRGSVKPEDLADLSIAIVQSSALRWVMSDRTFPARARVRAMLGVARLALDADRRAR